MEQRVAANWVVGKRLVHWGIALAVLVALIAPKPDDGDGLLHIAAGSTALALVLVRLFWRLLGDVRPYVKDSFRFKAPDMAKGARGVAPLLMQLGRFGGLVFLLAIPLAAGLGLVGVGQGEDSAALEAHEVVGQVIMYLAIGHALVLLSFATIMKYDILGVTLTGGARGFSEGGARAMWGMALGAGLAAALLAYVWGPYDVASKAAALSEAGESGEHYEEGGYERMRGVSTLCSRGENASTKSMDNIRPCSHSFAFRRC
jgi:cytochrome b561